MHFTRRIVPAILALTALSVHAQSYTQRALKGGSISVGGTGKFDTILTQNSTNTSVNVASSRGGTIGVTASNQNQYTKTTPGFVGSFQFHPVSFAGIELNYGFTHYQERFAFNYSTPTNAAQQVRIPVDVHEATAAYLFHPKHIKFQPYVGIGGGAIDFVARYNTGPNQWRGAGLLELGFDIPTKSPHIAFRVSGRSLYYRSPNFRSPVLSTRSWRVTSQPEIAAVYRF